MSTVQRLDYSVDLLKALLWEHDNAERLETLLRRKQEWYTENQSDFWANWYRDVFNIDTANDFGLAVWGIILGIRLAVETQDTTDQPHFGFGVNHQNFGNGNFATVAGENNLDTEQKRLVIKMRYFQLTTNGTVPQINEFMAAMFGDRGDVYIVDDLDMSGRYFFSFAPDASLRYIINNFDIFPRPAAVGLDYQIQVKDSFGFGVNHLNFNNGNFGA